MLNKCTDVEVKLQMFFSKPQIPSKLPQQFLQNVEKLQTRYALVNNPKNELHRKKRQSLWIQ